MEEYPSHLLDIIGSEGLSGVINCLGPRNRLSQSLCFCRKWKHRGITEVEVTSWLSKQICTGLKMDLRSLCINTEMLALVTRII